MQTPKKRKRETVEAVIRYDAPSRTFDRLFKEQSLEEMKDVVRKKLGVATSIPIYLSQTWDGRSVDLEDDDDFDALRASTRASHVVQVKVVVGSDAPNGDSEKKKKKYDAAVSSSVASSSALVDSPPQKKRHVSFVDPPGDQPEQSPTVVPATLNKKKRKHAADYSTPPDPSDISLVSTTNGGTEKKKKKKKTPATVSEELATTHTENAPSDAEIIPETPPPKKTKKRSRGEDISQVLPSQTTDSVADEEDENLRPAKKSKKKPTQTDSEPVSSRSKSVPPQPTRKSSTVDLSPTVSTVEPEASIKSTKQGKERGVSEPPSAAAPSSPEVSNQGKGKSKAKANDYLPVDPSTTTRLKAAEVKKKKTKLVEEAQLSDSAIPDPITKKHETAAESPQTTLPTPNTLSREDKDQDEPSEEKKAPRRRKKSQDSSKTAEEKHRDSENFKVATLAAVQAVLERKGIPSVSPKVLQATTQPPLQGATSEGEEELPAEEEELPAEEELSCLLCDQSPTHDRPLCPVIQGGVRAMRKRVGQLERDTSGDETKQEKRQQAIAELQAIIQKRARGPRKGIKGAVAVKEAPVTQNKDPLPAAPAPIAKATKTSKQVDVVSPPTRVVDVVLPIVSSKPVKPTPSTVKSSAKQPSPSQPPPASQQPSSSVSKTAQGKVTTEKIMANLPLVDEPSLVTFGDLPFEDLSQVTDTDLQSIIHGRGVSIADVPSSDEDEDDDVEDDEQEPVLDEDEPDEHPFRRLSQGSTRLEYSSPSDAEEEDDDLAEGNVSKAKETSPSTEGEDLIDNGQILPGEGNTLFGEVDTRGSSREIDRTGDDAFDAALAKDFATLNAVLPINGKRKGAEVDSDTAVGSQVEEIVDVGAKEKKVRRKTATDPIEPSKEPAYVEPDLVVSDDDNPPAQSTPMVESTIKTRSQRRKDTEQQEDSVVPTPKTLKKARKITEMPVPLLPSARVMKSSSSSNTNARRFKAIVQQDDGANGSDGDDDDDRPPPQPSTNGKFGSKAPVKDTKRTRSKTSTSETSKGKTSTKARVSAVNGSVSKAKSKITPKEPIGGLAEAINRASGSGNNIFGSQWAVLQESNPLTETPGQVDELHSDFTTHVDQTPLMIKQSREPLFLPSQTPQSFPFSQFATTTVDDARDPSHESEDEDEVLASVVKPVQPVRTYRSLSQIASSQTFNPPEFQPADFETPRDPESLYGRNRRDVVSDTESSSESDEDRLPSHIPASRRAGLPPFFKK